METSIMFIILTRKNKEETRVRVNVNTIFTYTAMENGGTKIKSINGEVLHVTEYVQTIDGMLGI